jgi:hypothetical protein
MSLVMFVNPNTAQSTDKLIVTDTTGVNNMFVAGDSAPIIRLNSNAVPASVPSYAIIYGSKNNDNTGLVMDSYASRTGGEPYVTLGAGGAFRFAEGTQASPTAVGLKDRLGFFVFSGYDGTEFVNAAGFTAKVDSVTQYVSTAYGVSTGYVPARLAFETQAQPCTIISTNNQYVCTGPAEVPDDGGRVERMVISADGFVGIGGSGSSGQGIGVPLQPLVMGSGAYVTVGGVWTNASSRAYKENIKTLTREEADQVLDGLSPVKFNYKKDKQEEHVGFIAEDVPDLVATKDRKGLSPMDIVAVLTRVVQEQKDTIAEQTNMISELSKRLDAMQQEINKVKSMNIVGSIGESIK